MSMSLVVTIQYSIVLRDANQMETNLRLLIIANRHRIYFLSSFLVH